jgi:hypothetical protein
MSSRALFFDEPARVFKICCHKCKNYGNSSLKLMGNKNIDISLILVTYNPRKSHLLFQKYKYYSEGNLKLKLPECPQCDCGEEIQQMLTFLIYLSCPKAYHRPDHLI